MNTNMKKHELKLKAATEQQSTTVTRRKAENFPRLRENTNIMKRCLRLGTMNVCTTFCNHLISVDKFLSGLKYRAD